MKTRLNQLSAQRAVLLKTIDAQREALAEEGKRWQQPLTWVDAGLNVVRTIRQHPFLFSSAFAAFLAWRRKGIGGLAQEGRKLWQFYPALVAIAMRRQPKTQMPSDACL